MTTRLSRWGHSTGLRVPRHVLECAGLRAGDEVYVRALENGDVLIRAVKPRPDVFDESVGRPAPKVELTEAEILADW
jgi:antitoxin component of MazEF toxin-antitoxin module